MPESLCLAELILRTCDRSRRLPYMRLERHLVSVGNLGLPPPPWQVPPGGVQGSPLLQPWGNKEHEDRAGSPGTHTSGISSMREEPQKNLQLYSR